MRSENNNHTLDDRVAVLGFGLDRKGSPRYKSLNHGLLVLGF